MSKPSSRIKRYPRNVTNNKKHGCVHHVYKDTFIPTTTHNRFALLATLEEYETSYEENLNTHIGNCWSPQINNIKNYFPSTVSKKGNSYVHNLKEPTIKSINQFKTPGDTALNVGLLWTKLCNPNIDYHYNPHSSIEKNTEQIAASMVFQD